VKTEHLSDFIDGQRPELLERWISKLRQSVTGEELPREDLEDRFRSYLRKLVEALKAAERGESSKERLLAPARSTAAEHGGQRLELGYDIAAVVRDYAFLREVLDESLAAVGLEPTAKELSVLSAVLMDGVASAVHTYTLERDAKVRAAAAKHVGFLVHELRQPLQTLRLRLDILARSGRSTSPEDVVAIHKSVQALSETVEGALFESRFNGLQELQLEEVDATTLIRNVAEDVGYVAEAKGIAVQLESTDAPIVLEADRRLLRSALSNLAFNAVKFSPDGSSVRLRASAPETGKVVFEVQDSCGGLPEGAVEKMFSPFVQLGKDRSGFGLGLALARQVSDAHGGALRVHDVPGTGCIFVLELPATGVARIQ
jgi:signal transduction histidine kinase